MPQRTIEAILVEWRAAEALLGDGLTDAHLAELIEALRAEHAAAVEARRAEARELARHPGEDWSWVSDAITPLDRTTSD